MSYRQNYRRSAPRPARWMTLKYPGTCKVCAAPIPAGETGYYDPATRTVTCYDLACCEADGLTRQEWNGSPVSGRWITVRSERRIGRGHASEPVRDPGEDMADRWNETHS
jgi:hypothetical protein